MRITPESGDIAYFTFEVLAIFGGVVCGHGHSSNVDGNWGERFSVRAAAPSTTSGPMNVNISYAADWSKMGPAAFNQFDRLRLVHLIAGCDPVPMPSAMRNASSRTSPEIGRASCRERGECWVGGRTVDAGA